MQNDVQPYSLNHPFSTKPWYKRPLILVMIALLVTAGAVFGLLYLLKDKQVSVADQKLTLYYNDSKTVLWQTGQDEGDNAAVIAYARNQLKTIHGNDYQAKGAWKVTTTLDKNLQDIAVQQFTSQRQAINRTGMSKMVLAAEDVTTGQIVSLATRQSQESGTNPIAKHVEPGTLVTPFSYIALLEKKPESANAVFEDTQTQLPGYPCTNKSSAKQGGNCLFNLDFRYLGPLSLPQALGGFRNVTAVKAAAETGQDTYRVAASMGSDGACYLDEALTQKTACYSAAVFGDGIYATPQRLLQAYATLANKGTKVPQTVLLKTVLNDKQQYAWQAPKADQVIRSQTATTISDILADPSVSFIQEKYKPVFAMDNGTKISVVSGYTQDSSSTGSIQFTDRYVVGFWGSDNTPLLSDHVQGAAIPIASALLKATK